jgi:ABC-type antimicrobial peptide transport system permease subunit
MGTMGVLLAMIGLYGLVSYAAARRTREIGIRMALGAEPAAVVRLVLRHGLWLAAAGSSIGLVGSIAMARLLRATIPGTEGTGLATPLTVVPALLAIILCAAYIPARRAARIDPLLALRQE